MLTSLLAIVLLFSVSSYNLIFANNEDKDMDMEDEIELQESSLGKISIRSFFKPFRATKSTHSINVYCLQDLDNITIEIMSELSQVVYSKSINTTFGENIHIDIRNWPSGVYYIQFQNSSVDRIYGVFEISGKKLDFHVQQ